MKKWTIPAIVIGAVVLVVMIFAGTYNSLVGSRESVKTSFSNLETQYQRRADLIPNLVESVKGYAAHESGVFERVTAARSAVVNSTSVGPAAAAEAENQLTGALKSLFAVAESYPDLKASQNFLDLQAQITDTEDKVSASRRFYNSAVTQFNTKRKVFPTNIFANMLGFTQDKEFYDVPEAERETIEQVPEVKF